MAILLISDNPLFVEAISETLADRLGTELHSASPEEALERIQAEHVEVILVDEAIPPGMLKQILKQARRVNKTRLILLNCTDNDFIVLDSHPATISNVDDLVQSIRRTDLDQNPPFEEEKKND